MRTTIAIGALLVSAHQAQAGEKGVALATAGNETAKLICDGEVVLEDVTDLRLAVLNGTIIVTYRPLFGIHPKARVLVIRNWEACEAHETF